MKNVRYFIWTNILKTERKIKGETMKYIKCLSIFFIVIVLVGWHKIDQGKFENLHRAVKQIEGSQMAGVNYVKFGELLQNFATELLITKDKVKTKEEKDLLELFIKTYDTYSDSYSLWKKMIDWNRSFIYYSEKDKKNVDYEDIEQNFIKKYNLNINKDEDYIEANAGIYLSLKLVMRKIWAYASVQYIEKIDLLMQQ